MRLNILLGLGLLWTCSLLGASKSMLVDSLPLNLLQTIPVESSLFTTDRLQQIYLLADNSNEVIKYSSEGKEIRRYSNSTIGAPTVLDATDPFNLLLFYYGYQEIVFLDRTLSATQSITLYDLDFSDVQVVGLSSENQLWLYDGNDFKLKRLDKTSKIAFSSDDLSLLLRKEIRATQLLERNGYVYLNVPALGILVFDNYSQYLQTLDFKSVQQFQVLQQQLFFLQENQLYRYHLQSKLTTPLPIDFGNKEILQFQIQQNRLYLLTDKGIEIYLVK